MARAKRRSVKACFLASFFADRSEDSKLARSTITLTVKTQRHRGHRVASPNLSLCLCVSLVLINGQYSLMIRCTPSTSLSSWKLTSDLNPTQLRFIAEINHVAKSNSHLLNTEFELRLPPRASTSDLNPTQLRFIAEINHAAKSNSQLLSGVGPRAIEFGAHQRSGL